MASHNLGDRFTYVCSTGPLFPGDFGPGRRNAVVTPRHGSGFAADRSDDAVLHRIQRLDSRPVGPPVGAPDQTRVDQFQAREHALDLGAGAEPSAAHRAVQEGMFHLPGQLAQLAGGLRVEEVAERHVGARRQGIDVFGHDALRAALTVVVVQRAELEQRDRLREVKVQYLRTTSSLTIWSGLKMSASLKWVWSFSSSSARPCASTTGSLSTYTTRVSGWIRWATW